MSHFTVLIFNNEKQKDEIWELAQKNGIELWESGYGVNPSIPTPHVFINDILISSKSHYYDKGCRNLEDIFFYEKQKVENKKTKSKKYQEKKRKNVEEICLQIEKIKERYLVMRTFIEEVVEKCDSISILAHFSDHSENERVPIKEVKKIMCPDLTIETLIFLSDNVLLKILKQR